MDDVPLIGVGDEVPKTTTPQHGTPATAQPPPPPAPQPPAAATQPIPQLPVAMAGSYPTAVYPNVVYPGQPGTVQFIQAPRPALQPQAQVSYNSGWVGKDVQICGLTCVGCSP